MGYLNESGLARYDGLIKNWVTMKSGTVDGVDALLNWQKTSTAGAVTCYPLPAAPIDPVVNFLFTETGPTSGEKSPSNPSTITGVTQAKVTRCGKNLIRRPYLSEGSGVATIRGVTFATDENTGVVTVNGTASGGDATFWVVGNTAFMRLEKNKTYFLSGCPSGGSADTYLLTFTRYNLDGSYGASLLNDIGSGSSASYTEDWKPIISIRVKDGTTVSNLVFRPQLELGTTATAFEPYEGTDYTVNLGDTYYGGSLDVSTGVMTVTWWANIFNGTENWQKGGNSTDTINEFILTTSGVVLPMSSTLNSETRCCSHFPFSSSMSPNAFFTWGGTPRIIVYRPVSENADVTAFKTWLAAQYANGTPVVVGYKLATSFTVQLTPTQIYSLSQSDPYIPRLNTVYSDQVSVQVGYPKSPLATSTELSNAIISLGGNI